MSEMTEVEKAECRKIKQFSVLVKVKSVDILKRNTERKKNECCLSEHLYFISI